MTNAYNTLVENPEGKNLLGRRRKECNIKINLE
jgi:hypothetical protein